MIRTGWLVLAIVGGASACKGGSRPATDPEPAPAPPPPEPASAQQLPEAPPDAAPSPPPSRPTLPDAFAQPDVHIGGDKASPDAVLAYDVDAATAAIADSPPTPVTLTIATSAGKDMPAIDVEAALRPRFGDAGLDALGADPVARVDVKCRERPGPTFVGIGDQAGTWTKVSCAMVVTPTKGKRRTFAIETDAPRTIGEGVDDASRDQFLGSYGVRVLPEVAAVALGRARRAPVLASLAVGLSREQRIGPLRDVLAPYLAKLPPSLRACVAVAQRKFKDAAALGEAALPALWQLLTSDWATAETVPYDPFPQFSTSPDVRAVVAQRLPAVKALASIGGVHAAVLAGVIALGLPVEPPDSEDDQIYETSMAGGLAIDSTTMHPGSEEGKLLVVLLKLLLDENPPGADGVLAKFAGDHRRNVRKAATGG